MQRKHRRKDRACGRRVYSTKIGSFTKGLRVQDEAFDKWERGKRKWLQGWNVGEAGTDGAHAHFAEWAETDLQDMILRDCNHPSVIMWSIGNEIDYPNDPYTHEVLNTGSNPQIYRRGYDADFSHSDCLGEIARRLVVVAKMYDMTRPCPCYRGRRTRHAGL